MQRGSKRKLVEATDFMFQGGKGRGDSGTFKLNLGEKRVSVLFLFLAIVFLFMWKSQLSSFQETMSIFSFYMTEDMI